MRKNIILNSDSYKFSQYCQYPDKTEFVFSYIESRGGIYDKLVFFGLQMFLKDYLKRKIKRKDIDRAERLITKHGEPFYREGWEYILKEHGGRLPVKIHAVDEGTVIQPGQILLWIRNTDPKCWWLTSFLETALLRAIWYPTTVASNSYASKLIIKHALRESGDEALLPFKLHDFGARGVSSWESAGIGGLAHLVNFMGTDTVTALEYAEEFYDAEEMPAFSVPAMEHSTVTSWKKENEIGSYRNMIKIYGKPGSIVSIVSDSYDIYEACKMYAGPLKQEIIDSGATLVVRPDSGDPSVVLKKCLQILEEGFGSVTNEKGFKVLNHVRVLWGDGINHQSIRSILFTLMLAKYSADNVVFGQGGALLQINNRDDLKFAMKCSAAYIDGEWVDVFKDPITDSGKKSKKGRLDLILVDGEFKTVRMEDKPDGVFSELKLRFLDGMLFNLTTLAEVRERANA